jgi:hypothetical protein
MAYMEFIRGKYDLADIAYLERLVGNMTFPEQSLIVSEGVRYYCGRDCGDKDATLIRQSTRSRNQSIINLTDDRYHETQ